MTETEPYVQRGPGDLVTAEDWNEVQRKIFEDIRKEAKKAADGVVRVPNADDSDHIEGKDLNALTEEITKRVLDQVRGRSGYQQLFKVLKQGEITVLEHKLGTAPLVDAYKLEYFRVVCREDDETTDAYATFFLHHTSERKIRVPGSGSGSSRDSVDIQPKDFPELGVPFAELLARYKVPYTDTTSLDDLETEFWKAFFRDPNDQFNDDQYCHSPWFERCCKEQQSVRQLKEKGDWDDIVFQMRPRKVLNYTDLPLVTGEPPRALTRPANVLVQHLDNNRTAVWFEGDALHDPDEDGVEFKAREYIGVDTFDQELKVMLLLKV
ncbi:hypothetical protein [Amycolatopsis nigrescens]|uniref:hypothetical protein n=1 Tax=Amycolatopsis nigrescens TaxID=381445 RepID=UPI000378F235|nr:hypothetical protein [Amycolatopsis nigrescens]